MRQLEQSKLRGLDYPLLDLVALALLCQVRGCAGGGCERSVEHAMCPVSLCACMGMGLEGQPRVYACNRGSGAA